MTNFELLRSLGTVTQFKKDEIVFMEDDYGDNIYIVLKGEFGVYVNSFVDFPVHVAVIGQGSFFGEMSVIDGWPRSATIKAEQDCAALAVSRDNFAQLLEKSPDIADSIIAALRSRAQSTAETVRKSGRYTPAPPSDPDPDSTEGMLALMSSLARFIRQTNSMLYEPVTEQKGIINLLPPGYTLYDIKDENDNRACLQARRIICPYCKASYEEYIPQLQKLTPIESRIDGRVIYKDFNILLYTNLVCHNCNYTDSYREFCKFEAIPEKPIYSGVQFSNTERFTGYAETFSHTIDEAILSYYLNIACLNRVTSNPLRFAKAYIKLYWIYDDLREKELVKQTAGKALENYDRFLSKNKSDLSEYDELRINIILAELSAAMGDTISARKYYETNARMGGIRSREGRELVTESLRRHRELSSHS